MRAGVPGASGKPLHRWTCASQAAFPALKHRALRILLRLAWCGLGALLLVAVGPGCIVRPHRWAGAGGTRVNDGLWVGPINEPDRYQLIESLGGGGEGEVWRAQRRLSEGGQSRSTVAVKDFGPAHAPAKAATASSLALPTESVSSAGPETGAETDPELELSWSRHVSLLQALQHPHIVRVLDGFVAPAPHWYGEASPTGGPRRYLVMGHVDALPLSQWCRDNPTADLKTRFRLARQVASALDYLISGNDTNGVPVTHGDVKPANVLVKDDGSVVLVDFGLANLADGTGRLGMGTYGYMAPELIAAGPAARPSPDSDRFAFAAMLVFLLTGQAPPQVVDGAGRPVDADRDATRQALTRSPLLANVPFLADLVVAGLALAPDQRPRSLVRWLSDVGSTTLTSAPIPQVSGPGPSLVTPGRSKYPKPPTAVPVPPPGRPSRRRGLVVAATAAAVLALLGGAGAWALQTIGSDRGGTNDIALRPSETGTVVSTSTADGKTASTGVPASPSQTILDQMPEAINIDVDQVQETLVEAGFEVDIETQLVDNAVGSRVVAQDPPAGTRLSPGQTVTLTVAQRPVQVYLADLPSIRGNVTGESQTLNGEPYPRSLAWSSRCGGERPVSYEYDLGRHYRSLTAMLGIDDQSGNSQRHMQFEVFLDDRSVAQHRLKLGETEPLDLDVAGVLRLRLVLAPVENPGLCGNVVGVWGDPILYGSPDEVPAATPGP